MVVIPSEIEQLAKAAVDAAFCVHRELGPGLLESAYEACYLRELELRRINCQKQIPIPLCYKGGQIESGFRADVIVEKKLLVELKAVEQIAPIHKAQVITYLKILKLPLGIMVNFNEVLIRDGITRVLNIQKT
jgi:GxxExxY protein